MNMNWFRNTKKNTDNDSDDSKKNDNIDNEYKKTNEPQIENNTSNEQDTLSNKLELVQQEYHKIVHELMTSKKEFNKMNLLSKTIKKCNEIDKSSGILTGNYDSLD